MVSGIITRGLFYWLRAPRNYADKRTDEWILSVIRLLLGICYLGAIIRPNSTQALATYEVLSIFYLSYGLLISLILIARPHLSPYTHIAIHLADILWATQLAMLIQWPAMAFILFFFIMISAAFRWGFWEAHLTLAAYFVLFTSGLCLSNPSLLSQWMSQGISILLPEASLYIGLACMAGLIAEVKAVRSENQMLSRMVEGIRGEATLEQAIGRAASEGRELFGATQLIAVLHDRSKNRTLMFRAIGSQTGIQSCELEPSLARNYSFPLPGISARMTVHRHHARRQFSCHTFADGKLERSAVCGKFPAGFLAAHPFHLMLAATLDSKEDWVVRAYIVDPSAFFGGTAALRAFHYFMQHLNPVLHDLFLAGRLQARAEAEAGSRMAREMHDGIIQSLSCINIQLENLRLRTSHVLSSSVDPLTEIQKSVQEEITSLRNLTQQLRAQQIEPHNLLAFLAGMAAKFEVEHGITTQFIAEIDEVKLPPKSCVEVARIVQEALVNIRKHSDALEAIIYLTQRNGHFVLRIIDNGRGFSFSGRRSHSELEAAGIGPIILMERAKTIGGEVVIESQEGSGTCLEIKFPSSVQWAVM